MKKRKSSRHRKRVLLLQAVFLLLLGAIVARLQFVQQVFGPNLLAQAKKTQDVTQTIVAPRGEILDAQGQPLAYDTPAFMMDVKVSDFSDRSALLSLLATALNIPVDQLTPVFDNSTAKWIRWPNPISEIQKEAVTKALQQLQDTAVKQAKTQGKSDTSVPEYVQDATFTPTEQRIYPYGDFAANVLGYVNHKGVGEAGLELEYNSILSGTPGEMTYVKDGDGFPIESTEKMVKQPHPGENIQTTIDGTIQGYVEDQMNSLVKKYKPQHAAIIVANPNTGAILGMSSSPSFNPNQYWNAPTGALSTNWAVNSTFEPGSTFKVLTLAAALATNSVNLNSTYMSGHMYVDGIRINDWQPSGWGRITFRQAMEYSSNVGFATIALHLGWSNLLNYMKAFGYLSKTGIDLPNEASSIVFGPSQQGPVQLATSGFGQGIAVTPIQQVAGVGAIANGGKLMKPYVVSKITNSETGSTIKKVSPTVVNPQVVPPNVASEVNQVMLEDVTKGIDSIANVKGYQIAGKTGTAQIESPNGGYYANRYIVSFIGYAPESNPQVEVYVTVYWPKTAPDNQWGSTVAAPVARDLLKECMDYEHISPASQQAATPAVEGKTQYVETPSIQGMSVAKAKSKLKSLGIVSEVIDTGKTVRQQWPQAGIAVAKGSKMYLYAPSAANGSADGSSQSGGSATKNGASGSANSGSANSASANSATSNSGSQEGLVTMPNLRGTSLREAGDILAVMGLKLSATGSGYATSQSVAAGTKVAVNSTVHIVFSSPTP